MSTWVYVDIHGAGLEFRELVKRVHKPGDIHICVGDLFDRGLDARIVWETMQEYGIKSTRGNHEQKMLRFLTGKRSHVPKHYHYALNELITKGVIKQDDFIDYLDKLPLIIRVSQDALVTHGGVVIDSPWTEDESANIYGNLTEPIPYDSGMGCDVGRFWWDNYHLDTVVFYGHVVHNPGTARIRHDLNGKVNSVGLDTYVVHGGPMTAACVETLEVQQYKSGIDWNKKLKELLAVNPIIYDLK